MIDVTRLNGEPIVVNAAFIEFLEATPDTVISLATGRKMMVRESVDEVVERIVAYLQRVGRTNIIHQDYSFGADDDADTD